MPTSLTRYTTTGAGPATSAGCTRPDDGAAAVSPPPCACSAAPATGRAWRALTDSSRAATSLVLSKGLPSTHTKPAALYLRDRGT
jgi:hypothetical protein